MLLLIVPSRTPVLPVARSRLGSSRLSTWVGALAIPLWATWPALSLETREMPPLECLGIVFAVACAALGILERPEGALGVATRGVATPRPGRPWILALAFAAGETGSGVFFLLATHHIPAAEANLITYLWPGLTVAFAGALGIFELKPRHIMGILLGFAAVAVLMSGSIELSMAGIALAFLAGVSWALYCVFRLRWRGPTGPLLARGFGLSALLCVALHFALESTVLPTLRATAAALTIGIVPTALGMLAWDQGLRRGDGRVLAVMAYATPLCSALLLTGLGLQSFTWRLLLGAMVVVAAGLASRADD